MIIRPRNNFELHLANEFHSSMKDRFEYDPDRSIEQIKVLIFLHMWFIGVDPETYYDEDECCAVMIWLGLANEKLTAV